MALSLKAGTTGSATVNVTPTGGFTGTVSLSCPSGNAFTLAGYTCSISPAQVDVSGAGPQTATLTLTPSVTLTAGVASTEFPRATFGTALGLWSVVFVSGWFVLGPARIRMRASGRTQAVWARGCAVLTSSLLIGCGSGGGGGGGGGGPYPTTTSLSIQQSGMQLRVTATVQSGGATPAGSVALTVDGGTPLTGSVISGLATFNFTPAPAVGIHTLDAHYSGDANNQASDSGPQTSVMTGSTTIVVNASSGNISAPASLALTLN